MPLLVLPQATSAQYTFPTSWRGSARWSVEFSPTTTPTQTPVWTDVTSYVLSVSITRGRQRVLDRFEAGTCTISLDNSARTFDPAYTAGPYYGNLVPMRQFRVRVQYGNSSYTRFTGFVDSYDQVYDRANRVALCNVQLTDAFKVLALARPPSPWAQRIQSFGSSVSAWYRLSESEVTTGLRDSSNNNRDGTYVGNPLMNQTGLISNDTNGCVQFTGSEWAYSDSVASMNATIYLEAWFSTTSATAQTIVAYGDPDSGTLLCSIELNASGNLVYRFADTVYELVYTDTSTSTYNNGLPHHVALYRTSSLVDADVSILEGPTSFTGRRNSIKQTYIEVDGSTTFSTTRTSSSLSGFTGVANRLAIGSNFGASQFFVGKIDEVVVYVDPNVVLSLDGNYETGYQPYNNQNSGNRVNTVLNLMRWPATERSVSTGAATLQSADFTGSVLDHLQSVQTTEQGRFFIDSAGKVNFVSRRSVLSAAPTITLSDAGTGVRFSDLAFTYDDVSIRNTVIAQRDNGGQITYTDPTSVVKYYERTYEQSGLLYNDDNQTRDFASWIVQRYSEPLLRVSNVELEPERDPTVIYPVTTSMELGAVLTVSRTPQGIGSAISLPVTVEGIDERISPSDYSVQYKIENAEISYYWILGDSKYGKLDETTLLAF